MGCNCKVRNRLLREPYKLQRGPVYMDFNATAPMSRTVLVEYERALRTLWANPASQHSAGVAVYSAIEEAQNSIAKYFGEGWDIKFGSSATALLNKVCSESLCKTVVTTVLDHNSVIGGAKSCIVLPVSQDGEIDLEELQSVLKRESNALLVLSPINHEVGTMQPIKEIYEISKRLGATLLLDAVQAIVRMGADEWIPYCDMAVFAGHKIGAPQGTAVLAIRSSEQLQLKYHDPSLEFSLYEGSVNGPAIIALASAFESFTRDLPRHLQEMSTLTREGAKILYEGNYRIDIETPPSSYRGVLCISLPEIDDIEELLIFLSEREIFLSRFSACNWDLSAESRVLKALGRPELNCRRSLRLSLGAQNQKSHFFILRSAIEEAHLLNI